MTETLVARGQLTPQWVALGPAVPSRVPRSARGGEALSTFGCSGTALLPLLCRSYHWQHSCVHFKFWRPVLWLFSSVLSSFWVGLMAAPPRGYLYSSSTLELEDPSSHVCM